MIRDLLPLATAFALLFAVSLLPPDTSFSEVDARGRLSVCMPDTYPPLVTGDPDRPGFDVEVLEAVTEQLGWRLNVISKAEMGRNFNPRSWHINRAQCQMLAGGIALNITTRSFLDTSKPHLVTGWAYIAEPGTAFKDIEGPVGYLAGLTGLNRIALGRFLRERGIEPTIVNSPQALRSALENGDYAAAITEALLAEQTFDGTDHVVSFMPAPLERFALGFGFWKGDLTLKQEIEAEFAKLKAEGAIAEIADAYEISATEQ